MSTQTGTAGNDTLLGTAIADSLDGGDGNDWLEGSAGNDALIGGAGDDVLAAGAGSDTLEGGTEGMRGDWAYFLADASGVQVNLSTGTAIDGWGAFDVLVGMENVYGSNFSDTLVGNAGNNVLTGNNGNDYIEGGAGHDELYGIYGNDTLDGGDGSEWMQGGSGNDVLLGGSGRDYAFYAYDRANYEITPGMSYTIVALTGTEGSDVLTGMDRLSFGDVGIAIDLDGNAGVVAKVLGAVFGHDGFADPLYAGIGLDYADAGWSYESLMQMALQVRLDSASPSNEAVVDLLHLNVMGSLPDAQTREYFVSWITDYGYTQASLAVAAADYMGIPASAQGGLEYI